MNQSGLTSGIALLANGCATNDGAIVIGSRVQNTAGMSVSGASNATLPASGAGSVAVNGIGATGVNIEGGAQGNIDAATTINLSGSNAISAIADGQKHTLTGANSRAPVASTRLTSAAERHHWLSSTQPRAAQQQRQHQLQRCQYYRPARGGWRDATINVLGSGNGIENRAELDNVSLSNLTLNVGDSNDIRTAVVFDSASTVTTNVSGSGNGLTFKQITARGGSFSADDLSKGVNLGSGWRIINFADSRWTLTDNLQLAHSTINIDALSTLYAGDNVHPTLAGGTADSLLVNNSGTLDLTNGGGSPGNTQDINGSLASAGGQANLVTRLDDGGALSNQFTDHINSSGTTLLNVRLDAASRR